MNRATQQFTLTLNGYDALNIVAEFDWQLQPKLDYDLKQLYVENDPEKQYIFEFLAPDTQAQIDARICDWIAHGERNPI